MRPRHQQRQWRRSRLWRRTSTTGPSKSPCHPSPHVPSPRPPGWQPTLATQPLDGQTLPLNHNQVRNIDPIKKKLTSRRQPRLGVEHGDPAHQVVVHGKLHGDPFSPRHCRLSNVWWRGGASTSGRHGGGGIPALEAADFALGRTTFTSRLGYANLTWARRFFRCASWRSFSITADKTAPTFLP